MTASGAVARPPAAPGRRRQSAAPAGCVAGEAPAKCRGSSGAVLASSGVMVPVLLHEPQHDLLAGAGGVRMHQRIVGGGRLDQAGQQRRLRQVQLGGRLAKVDARGRLHAIGELAEVDLVEVHVQDGVAIVGRREAQGQHHLAGLADQGARVWRSSLDMSRSRASCWVMVLPPETDSPATQGLEGSPSDPGHVHARMPVEVGVFDGQNGLDQVGRAARRG